MKAGLTWLMCMLAFYVAMGCATHERTLQTPLPAGRAEGTAVSAETNVHPLLASTAAQALDAGAGPMETVATGIRGAGEALTGMAVLPQDRCALIYARAGSTVVDLDLHAFADDGTQFGSDEGPDARPSLLVCAHQQTVRLFLSAKVAQGLGLVSLGLHDVDPTVRVRVSDAMGVANHALKVEASDQGWPTLDEDIAAHLTSLGGDWRDVRRVALPVDARVATHFDADLGEFECLSVLVLPEDPYLQLDLQVKSDSGRVLAQGVEVGAQRSAVICNHGTPTQLVFEVRPQSGQGFAVVALNVAPRRPAHWGSSRGMIHLGRPMIAVPKQELLQQISLNLALGQIGSVTVQSRGCQRYLLTDKAGRTSVLGKLRGWSPAGRLLGEGETAPGVPLLVCHTGPLVLDVEADEYVHSARLVVLAAGNSPALYENAALAASRADHRARLLQTPGAASTTTTAHALNVTPEHRVRSPLTLTKGNCAAFSVGGESSDGSFDIRLVDPATNQVLARGKGQTSAGAMLCSKEGREAVLEVVRVGSPTVALLVQTQWPQRTQADGTKQGSQPFQAGF